MATESDSDRQLEIAHVLFIDIVGYSKLLTSDQRERQRELNAIVRETEPFRAAEADGKLVRIATGDGMVLAFTFPQYDIYRRVSDYITLDMQLSYEFKKSAGEPTAAGADPKGSHGAQIASIDRGNFCQRMLAGTKLTVGVNDAFDRNPPTVLAALNDNYDTSLYTIRNRYYYIVLNKKF